MSRRECFGRVLAFALLLAITAGAARAHEVRPALLEIRRSASSQCEILWKQPVAGELAVRLVPRLSAGWLDAPPESESRAPGHRRLRWSRQACPLEDLESQSLAIEGLDATLTDVLVRVDFGDGRRLQHILRPGDAPLALGDPGGQRAANGVSGSGAYFRLGVVHILEGIDHLAFVLALVLLVGLRARLVTAVTGFTVAHSLTLGATALGWLRPWPAFIEALVALSILFVAAEALRARRGAARTLTGRWPELAALGFGLLHGFAFAGALAAIGLPRDETLLALLLFNLGVEAGQLIFIAAVLLVSLVLRRVAASLPPWAGELPAYAIGACAGFWTIGRVLVVLASPA